MSSNSGVEGMNVRAKVSDPKRVDDPKSRLAAMLKNGIDVGTLYQIADQLSTTDSSARFTVDAGHIQRLGFELVTKKETAVGELIKNAYDADAADVHLVLAGEFEAIEDEERRNATLTIIDGGEGMNREEIIAGFMRLSTPMKIDQPQSRNKRDRAGSKGIGRFATQRLGHRLDVYTQKGGERSGWHLAIDWDRFQSRSSLHAIASELQAYDRGESGTTIVISDLRDAWTPAAVTQLRNFIGPLVEPISPEGKPRKGKDAFNVFIERPGYPEINVQDEVYTDLLFGSLAKITGKVSNGTGKVHITSDLLGMNESLDILNHKDEAFRHLSGVSFVAYYYNMSPEVPFAPPRSAIATVRQQLRTHGGMRLYRNGFRVGPYGDMDNDWLSLDAQYRKRAQAALFPFGNANFFGYVSIHDRDQNRFEEAASREGLLDKPAFIELREFVFNSLIRAVGRIDAIKKTVAVKKPASERDLRQSIARVQHNARALKSARTASQRKALIDEIVKDSGSVQRQLKKYYTQHIEETGMLRVLASLGITLGGFMHELSQTITFIYTDLKSVASKLPAGTRKRLDHNATVLEDFTSYFDSILRDNSSRELREIELHDVMNQFEDFARAVCKDRGVQLGVRVDGFNVYTKPMHISEWSAILLNLLSNSLKAIRRAGKPGRVEILVRQEDKDIVIDFLDDGDGVPKENREKIFYPFFSTSTTSSDDFGGMGLGLSIVKDLVTANRGTIEVADAPNGFATCFHIVIPARKTETEN